jgi:hypothetical protein
VGVSASNSFILPTHQANALLMGPGGYRNADCMRAGGGMTLLFLAIAVSYIYLFLFDNASVKTLCKRIAATSRVRCQLSCPTQHTAVRSSVFAGFN